MEPQPTLPRRSVNVGGLFTIILVILLLFSLGLSAFFYYQNLTLQKQITTLSTVPSPIQIKSPNQAPKNKTTSWKNYSSQSFPISFSYPSEKFTVNDKEQNREITGFIYLNNNQSVGTNPASQIFIQYEPNRNDHMIKSLVELHTNGFTQLTTFNNQPAVEQIFNESEQKQRYQRFIQLLINDGVLSLEATAYDNNHETINELTQILSTFKFTGETISPSPKSVSYVVPSTWTKTTTVQGALNICLPPKWETGQYGEIVYNRDSSYRPNITSIQEIPYAGGSRREAYYHYWEAEYPNVQNLVAIKEINIDGNTALLVSPTTKESKESPEGLALVWYAGGKLWKAGLSNWNMVNDSQSAFLKDAYTAISCSF